MTHLIEVGGKLINTDEILYTRAPSNTVSTTEILFKSPGAERLQWTTIMLPLAEVNKIILAARERDAKR